MELAFYLIPALLLVRTGQPVNFLNHDDVLHNVRVRNDETKESAFNVAIPIAIPRFQAPRSIHVAPTVTPVKTISAPNTAKSTGTGTTWARLP